MYMCTIKEILLNNRNTDVFIYFIRNNKVVLLAHGSGIVLYNTLGTIFLDCHVKKINKKINCLEIEILNEFITE